LWGWDQTVVEKKKKKKKEKGVLSFLGAGILAI
jgi:hypothetical protein